MAATNDEQLYLEAAKEIDSGTQDHAFWIKAMTLADGDEEKAKYRYIALRVEQWSRTSEKTSSTEPSTSPYSKAPGESISENGNSHAGDAGNKKILTKEIAEEFLANFTYQNCWDVEDYTTLEDAAAESLGKHEGALDLDGLTNLSDVARESLSKHESFSLSSIASDSPPTCGGRPFIFQSKHSRRNLRKNAFFRLLIDVARMAIFLDVMTWHNVRSSLVRRCQDQRLPFFGSVGHAPANRSWRTVSLAISFSTNSGGNLTTPIRARIWGIMNS